MIMTRAVGTYVGLMLVLLERQLHYGFACLPHPWRQQLPAGETQFCPDSGCGCAPSRTQRLRSYRRKGVGQLAWQRWSWQTALLRRRGLGHELVR